MIRLPILFCLFCVCLHAVAVQDDSKVLQSKTRQQIEEKAATLAQEFGVHFVFRIEETFQLDNFERDSRNAFSRWIQGVEHARGAMLFLQLEKGSRRGRVNFSLGIGLEGALQREDVRRILRDKVLSFRKDINYQKELVDGIDELFEKLKTFIRENRDLPLIDLPGIESGEGGEVKGLKIFWIGSVLLISIIISFALFLWSRRRCPRCGSRLHINIRPLAHGESRFKRIKIIKCFDCNYFRKYLF